MIENAPGIYNATSVYNQGGGGGGGVEPLPDGYTKLMYAELTDNSTNVVVKLFENNEKNFSFFDVASISMYFPELDKNYAGINIKLDPVVRYSNSGFCSIQFKYLGQQKIYFGFNSVSGGGFASWEYDDSSKINYGAPQFLNLTCGREPDTGKYYYILNGVRKNGNVVPVSSNQAINYSLFSIANSEIPFWKGIRFFSFDVVDGNNANNVKMKVIPVKRNLDNVVGFFDLVSQKFYTAGLNAYLAGPPVV